MTKLVFTSYHNTVSSFSYSLLFKLGHDSFSEQACRTRSAIVHSKCLPLRFSPFLYCSKPFRTAAASPCFYLLTQ